MDPLLMKIQRRKILMRMKQTTQWSYRRKEVEFVSKLLPPQKIPKNLPQRKLQNQWDPWGTVPKL
jgi:hypothetical protein